MAINSQPRADRPSCQQIGFCFQGCKSSAKWSTLYTEIPAALETGNLELRPECTVLQIQHDDAGKVTGVLYADKDGKQQVQKARVVCVAGNSIESPRLLLNSASAKFPDGLANSSGQVGRNYMRHMTGSVYAAFDKPVHMFRGTTMAGVIQDEAGNDPRRGFVGGYEMETLSLGLPFMAAFLDPGAWGREFTRKMETYPNMAGMWLVGEDMPQESNRVTLHADREGRATACRSPTSTSTTTRTTSPCAAMPSGRARRSTRRPARTEVYETPPYPSTHNLGTNRMSEKPARRRGQQVGPDPRHQEPVRLRRQPVHHRRRREPDPDHRHAGDPAGGLHRRADGQEGDLRGLRALPRAGARNCFACGLRRLKAVAESRGEPAPSAPPSLALDAMPVSAVGGCVWQLGLRRISFGARANKVTIRAPPPCLWAGSSMAMPGLGHRGHRPYAAAAVAANMDRHCRAMPAAPRRSPGLPRPLAARARGCWPGRTGAGDATDFARTVHRVNRELLLGQIAADRGYPAPGWLPLLAT